MNGEVNWPAFWLINIALLIVYFVPWLTAWGRGHRQMVSIFALNLFLGWTLLGWVVALVWALTRPAALPPPAPTRSSFTYLGRLVTLDLLTHRAEVDGKWFDNAEVAKAHIDRERGSPPSQPAPAPAPAIHTFNHRGRTITIDGADGTASVDGIRFASPADAQTYIDRIDDAGQATHG